MAPAGAAVGLRGVDRLLASLLFIALNWRLGDNTSPVLAAIYQTNLPQVAIGNPAPAAPPTLSLKSFLRKEIAEGLVVVRDEAQQSVVILKGDGLFDSAATTVRANYIPVIDRIAAAMNGVSGKIRSPATATTCRSAAPVSPPTGSCRWRAPKRSAPACKSTSPTRSGSRPRAAAKATPSRRTITK